MEKPKSTDTKKSLETLLKDFENYTVPIIAILIFVAILVILVFPTYENISQNFQLLDSKKGEIENQKKRLTELELIATESIQNSEFIEKLDSIIPSGVTEVVAFQRKIVEIADENNIQVDDAIVGEKILLNQNAVDSTIQTTKDLYIVQIPIQFKLIGSVVDFENFLNDIYSGEDFIIVSEMNLNNNGESEDTTMNITLSKYQFLPVDMEDVTFLGLVDSIPNTAILSPNVIDFIERKQKSE